jgi:hypothetical protein
MQEKHLVHIKWRDHRKMNKRVTGRRAVSASHAQGRSSLSVAAEYCDTARGRVRESRKYSRRPTFVLRLPYCSEEATLAHWVKRRKGTRKGSQFFGRFDPSSRACVGARRYRCIPVGRASGLLEPPTLHVLSCNWPGTFAIHLSSRRSLAKSDTALGRLLTMRGDGAMLSTVTKTHAGRRQRAGNRCLLRVPSAARIQRFH